MRSPKPYDVLTEISRAFGPKIPTTNARQQQVESPELRILVIGGSSGVGRATVRRGLQRRHAVTAMARNPGRLTIADEKLDLFEGSILDASAVESAVQGQDAVVIAIGAALTGKPVSLFSEGTRNVLTAMKKTGASRLVLVTGIGAGDSRGHGGFFYDWILQPLALRTNYEDKDRAEALVRSSTVEWTIVRPGFLNHNPGKSRYRVITDLAGVTAGPIARADVAHFIVSALETGNYRNATVLLTD